MRIISILRPRVWKRNNTSQQREKNLNNRQRHSRPQSHTCTDFYLKVLRPKRLNTNALIHTCTQKHLHEKKPTLTFIYISYVCIYIYLYIYISIYIYIYTCFIIIHADMIVLTWAVIKLSNTHLEMSTRAYEREV